MVLKVTEVDQGEDQLVREQVVRVLATNTIGEVKKSIWINSKDYLLQPQVMDIRYRGRILTDSDRLEDIASDYLSGFELMVDSLLMKELPREVPDQDCFVVKLNQEHGESYMVNVNLQSNVSNLKDQFIDLHYKKFNRLILRYRIQLSYKSRLLNDNDLMNDILGVDIPPKDIVEVLVIISSGKIVTRFHIRINSEITELQDLNLFEIDKSTSLQTLKERIIDRINLVSPNFQTDGLIITNPIDESPIPDGNSIYSIMNLYDNLINQNEGIIDLNLKIESPTNQSETSNQPSSSTTKSPILPIEPMKIIVKDGEEWSLIGEPYERIIPNDQHIPTRNELDNIHKRELLINQSDLSPLLYDLTIDSYPNKKVTLNPSQCIIVDNPNYSPYLLLNPSGAAKLYNEFKLENGESLIQQVKVLQYNEGSNSNGSLLNHIRLNPADLNDGVDLDNENQNRNLQQFIRAAYNQFANRFLAILIRVLILLTIIDFSMPWKYWKFLILYGFVSLSLYCIFVAGVRIADKIDEFFPANDQPRPFFENLILGVGKILRFTSGMTTTILSNIGIELIRAGVSRTYDFEIIHSRASRNWYIASIDNVKFFMKDFLLYILSLSPKLSDLIELELQNWKNEEVECLKTKLFTSLELLKTLTEYYNNKHTPHFTIPQSLTKDEIVRILGHNLDVVDETMNEKRYRLMLEFYNLSELLCKSLNRSFISGQPLPTTDFSNLFHDNLPVVQ